MKRGQVARPLPEFAVIECPGGQVAFWWGVGGRNYRSGPEDRNWEAHWHTLRQNPEWKHVAIPAGQVWDEKIRERKKRERAVRIGRMMRSGRLIRRLGRLHGIKMVVVINLVCFNNTD